MVINLPTKRISVTAKENKHLYKSFTYKMAPKPAGIDTERNHVAVTLCTKYSVPYRKTFILKYV